MTSVEFERKATADHFREEHPDAICPDDDARLKTVQFAGIDREEWQEQKAQWAQDYREQGKDAPDEVLARAHVKARYGVDLETFEEAVVKWPDEREAQELENIVTSGLRTAQEGINRTTAILEAADVDGQDVLDESDVVVSDP